MIRFGAGVTGAICRHAEATYPEECCGVLLGRLAGQAREVVEALPRENSSTEERARRFLITAEDYRAAERAAGERGLTLSGFYHSHPDHPARPSQYDVEHALPWHSYVIVAVTQGRAAETTSWVLADDRSRFDPEPLRA